MTRSSVEVLQLFTERASLYQRFIEVARYRSGLGALIDHRGYLKPGARVLDAGCGTGAFTRALHAVAERRGLRDIRYHAFDLTPAMMAHLATWAHEQGAEIATQQADVLHLEELPQDWRDFDLIVSSAMLEYLPKTELAGALSQLASRLSPDGRLVVCISRRNVLMRVLIGAWWRSHLYSRDEVSQAFRDGGLKPEFNVFPGVFRYLDLWGLVVEARPGSSRAHLR